MKPNRWRASTAGMLLAMVVAAWGCQRAFRAPEPLPARYTLVRDQLILYSEFPLPARHRLLEALSALRGDVSDRLNLPTSDEPIHVYVFESAENFESFLKIHHPDLPKRRAFFLESDTRLAVYAFWGDRVGEDLQHEVAHGYLHSVVPHLPLWLDEGLAEYFEVPRGQNGLNLAHVRDLWRRLGERSWWPDLQRLEELRAIGEMTQLDYAEGWLWVHFLLETTPQRRELLQNYLHQLRQAGSAPPLAEVLRETHPRADHELVQHLSRLVGHP